MLEPYKQTSHVPRTRSCDKKNWRNEEGTCNGDHEVQHVEHCATCRSDKISPKLVLHKYIELSVQTRGHVAATYPWNMYPQHFDVCAHVAILSRLRSLLHVASLCITQAFRRCNMSLQNDPSCLPNFSYGIVSPSVHT